MATGRELPHSLEAEEMLLSCCMMDGNDVIPRAVVAKIKQGSFYNPKHGVIYDVMVDMFNTKKPTDIACLAEELKVRKTLDQIGGYAFLAQVNSRVPTTAQASFFIEKVREMAVLRELIRVNTAIVEDCYAYTGELGEFISSIQAKFQRGSSSHADEGADKPLGQVCDGIKAEAEGILAGLVRGDENDLSWGISDCDKFLKKFRRGELVCLAARPGIGKSSLMRQIVVRNVVRDGKNVVVFTLEVSTEEFIRNTVQAVSGVNARDIANYPVEEQKSFMKWVDKLGTMGDTLHVHDVNVSLAAIIANVRIHHARKPVDIVFVDYLQLINEKQTAGENRDLLMGRITRALKMLANELQCVIIILSQLNRAMEREDRPPMLADLRESGNIEQDCDRVDFIYRPKTKPDGTEQHFDDETVRYFYCEVLQRKGRNVGESSLGMNFERAAARFLPLERIRGQE